MIDYEQYYASLAASNAASAQATPSGLGSEDLDSEEEPKHPNQHHTVALNGYRKRSRSQDEEGAAVKKLARLDPEPPHLNGLGHRATGTGRGDDDPLVSGMVII